MANLDTRRIKLLTERMECSHATGSRDSSGWEAEKERFRYVYTSLLATGTQQARCLSALARRVLALPPHHRALFMTGMSTTVLRAFLPRLRALARDLPRLARAADKRWAPAVVVALGGYGEEKEEEKAAAGRYWHGIAADRRDMARLVADYLADMNARAPAQRLLWALGDAWVLLRDAGEFDRADRELLAEGEDRCEGGSEAGHEEEEEGGDGVGDGYDAGDDDDGGEEPLRELGGEPSELPESPWTDDEIDNVRERVRWIIFNSSSSSSTLTSEPETVSDSWESSSGSCLSDLAEDTTGMADATDMTDMTDMY